MNRPSRTLEDLIVWQKELEPRYRRLEGVIRRHGPMAVAYSGGVDSAFLAYAAHETLGDDMVCVIGISPSLAQEEYRAAVAFAESHGIPFEKISTDEMEDKSYSANGPDRCYYCKRELFSAIRRVCPVERFPVIAYGENADDADDRRPGARAATEQNVAAPLAEAGFTKRLVRDTARALGLEVWDKPAAPCLASRIPYFSEVTSAKLEQVGAAETVLEKAGFRVCRVRHHGDLARIEVPIEEHARLLDPPVWRRVETDILAAGFERVDVVPDGFRSGRLNEVLDGGDDDQWRSKDDRGS